MWSYPLEKWIIQENQWAEKDTKIHRDKKKLEKYQLKFLTNKSIIRASRVCQAKLLKELFRFSFSYIRWILLRAPRFLLIQACVSWICLHSVSNWSYWSRSNPSMACVAGAWKGRESGCFGAAPSRFSRCAWAKADKPSLLFSVRKTTNLAFMSCTAPPPDIDPGVNHLNCRSVIELNRTKLGNRTHLNQTNSWEFDFCTQLKQSNFIERSNLHLKLLNKQTNKSKKTYLTFFS